jgi:hypothetical protein
MKKNRFTDVLNIRLTLEQKIELRRKAIEENTTISDYVKKVLYALNDQNLKP